MVFAISVAWSLKGWKFSTWWKLNQSRIRLLLCGVAGIVTTYWPDDPWIKLLFGTGGGLICLLVLDTLDFFFSDVPVEQK